jgi:hypothetical protein
MAIGSDRIAYPGSVAPKILQRVKPAFVSLEHMNQNVVVVDDQPMTGW